MVVSCYVFTERLFEGLPQTVQVKVPSATCVRSAQISPLSPPVNRWTVSMKCAYMLYVSWLKFWGVLLLLLLYSTCAIMSPDSVTFPVLNCRDTHWSNRQVLTYNTYVNSGCVRRFQHKFQNITDQHMEKKKTIVNAEYI